MKQVMATPFAFNGDGEVRSLLRMHDWSASPLGQPHTWPQELLTVVNLLLDSRFPMFVAWGQELGFLYNDAYAEILGDKHPGALGRRFQDVWAETWSEVGPIIANTMAGKPTYFEDRALAVLRNSFPEEAWFTFSYSPVRDSHGMVDGVCCTVVETTGRVLSERRQAFRVELTERLRSLTLSEDIVAAASALLGQHLQVARVLYAEIDDANETFVIRQTWSRPGIASVAQKVESLDDFGPEMAATLRAGKTIAIDDIRLDNRTADHADAYARLLGIRSLLCIPVVKAGRLSVVLNLHQVEPYRWTYGEIHLAQDMVEWTWAAAENARAQAELLDADQRKDDFLAMLAHELRTPLAPISAAAELLGMAPLDAGRLKKTSQVLSRQVRHMTGLVDDLLEVSRVTKGLVTLDKYPQDLKNIVSSAVEQVRPMIEAQRHQFATALAPEPAYVLGDQKRLIQILANLLNNAAKYTPAGGHIQLSLEVHDAQILLCVVDNGIGIPLELQPHVFDLFSQAKRTSDRVQGGLGIGLALVKSLVGLHGGKVTCVSEGPGKGSQFTICLPRLIEPAIVPDRRDSEKNSRISDKKLRILVVEDNVDTAEMLTMFLEALGHEVLMEHSPLQALERARIDLPDVCLLDIGLPEIDGNELARRLRRQPETAHVPLIAITGYGQEHDRENALAAGFNHHFVKPVDAAKLSALLAEIGVS